MKAVKISDNKRNYLKDDGTYLLDEHVHYCWDFRDGFGTVQYYDKSCNFVNTEGKTLLKNNVDDCWNFENGIAKVEINDIRYLIDKECNFYNEDKVSFKKLYSLYYNIRSLLIEIIEKYTYYDVEEYFV